MSDDSERPRWGKAGVRLAEQQIKTRRHAAAARRNRERLTRLASNRIAYRLWRAGELKPYLITQALNAQGLYGPEVDTACGAAEPDVDLWEAGKLYPTWRQLLLLARLTGNTPQFLCSDRVPIDPADTTLRFHMRLGEREPTVWRFDPAAVAATVADTPPAMPEELS